MMENFCKMCGRVVQAAEIVREFSIRWSIRDQSATADAVALPSVNLARPFSCRFSR